MVKKFMEEALIKRIMPNSLEAEQSVIGSMIMDKRCHRYGDGDVDQRRFLSQTVWYFV